jgi:acetyl esterase/lipase
MEEKMPVVKIKMPEPGSGPMAMPTMDVSGISRKWLDVDYTPQKPHPARKLDIYLPETGDGPFPVLICMHGGAFSAGQKNDVQVAGYMEALPEGFAVASVEQRLCNMLPGGGFNREGLFPNPLFDFKAAIRFLRANAAQYRLDPARFAVAGGSAGGYHAIMAAATQDVVARYDASLGWADIPGTVHAVLDQFGVGDIVLLSEFTENAPPMKMPGGAEFKMPNYADIFAGINCREKPELAYFVSPDTWVTKKLPPVYLQHGAADEIVTVECSRRLAKRIREVCGADRVLYEEFEGYSHGDMRFNGEENLKKVFAWLKEKLG